MTHRAALTEIATLFLAMQDKAVCGTAMQDGAILRIAMLLEGNLPDRLYEWPTFARTLRDYGNPRITAIPICVASPGTVRVLLTSSADYPNSALRTTAGPGNPAQR